MKPYVKLQGAALEKIQESDLDKQRFNDEVYKTISSMQVKMPSAAYDNPKEENNTAVFTGGNHKGFILKNEDVIDGLANPTITASTELKTINRISNLYYSSAVSLTDSARIVFNNCRFDKPVVIASGGKAHFIGCRFANDSFVDNAGVAANAYVIGCIKNATATHINTTTIASFDA